REISNGLSFPRKHLAAAEAWIHNGGNANTGSCGCFLLRGRPGIAVNTSGIDFSRRHPQQSPSAAAKRPRAEKRAQSVTSRREGVLTIAAMKFALTSLLLLAVGLAACSTNPITGRSQLIGLVSEGDALQGSA